MAALVVAGCGGSGDTTTVTTSPSVASNRSASSLNPVLRIFDEVALEDGVRRVLTESYRLTGVGTVRCPSGQAVQDGSAFDCTVRIGSAARSVTLTVRGTDGTYEVSAPK